jgi:hypothetical protein
MLRERDDNIVIWTKRNNWPQPALAQEIAVPTSRIEQSCANKGLRARESPANMAGCCNAQ